MGKKFSIHQITYADLDLIPETCSFCEKKPIGILEIKRFFATRRRWICNSCRLKWIKGELTI